MYSGMIFRGRIKGAKIETRDNGRGQHVIGIGIQKSDGFGGTTEDVYKIKVNDQLVQSGIINQVNSLVGKLVEVPVTSRLWEMNGKSGISYNLAFDSGIVEVKAS